MPEGENLPKSVCGHLSKRQVECKCCSAELPDGNDAFNGDERCFEGYHAQEHDEQFEEIADGPHMLLSIILGQAMPVNVNCVQPLTATNGDRPPSFKSRASNFVIFVWYCEQDIAWEVCRIDFPNLRTVVIQWHESERHCGSLSL